MLAKAVGRERWVEEPASCWYRFMAGRKTPMSHFHQGKVSESSLRLHDQSILGAIRLHGQEAWIYQRLMDGLRLSGEHPLSSKHLFASMPCVSIIWLHGRCCPLPHHHQSLPKERKKQDMYPEKGTRSLNLIKKQKNKNNKTNFPPEDWVKEPVGKSACCGA